MFGGGTQRMTGVDIDTTSSASGDVWSFKPLIIDDGSMLSRLNQPLTGTVGPKHRLCWAHDPTDMAEQMGSPVADAFRREFVFEVGVFQVNGPTAGAIYCLTDEKCKAELMGVGFQATNKIRFIATTNEFGMEYSR